MTRVYALNDANLNLRAVVTSRDKLYADLNGTMIANPSTGDVYLSKDAAAVKQSIKNLILTNRFERPFQPKVGGHIRGLLFENMSPESYRMARERIRSTIQNYEPRAKLRDIRVQGRLNANEVYVTIEFQVVSTQETVSLLVTVERIR